MSILEEYLKKEWRNCNHSKYQIYFKEWFNNLTETQLLYFNYYSKGLKTPY